MKPIGPPTERVARDGAEGGPHDTIGPSLSRSEILSFYARTGYSLDHHPAHLIRRVHQRATAQFGEIIGGSEDLTPMQYAVLATLLRLGALSQNRLGRLAAMDPSTISTVVKKLVRRGLVRREASPTDQRMSMIVLTDDGVRCGLDHLDRSMEVGRRLLSPLSPSEQAVLLGLLHRLCDDDPAALDGQDADTA